MSILEAALRGGTVAVLLLLAVQTLRRRIGAVLVAALALHISAPCQAADVVALLSYVEHHDRILPFAEKTATSVRLEVRLSTEGTVQHNEARASGSARGGTRREGSAVLKLGAQQNRAWRVAGPDQLINITDFTSFQRAILVTVSGNSCTARIGYTLKPGFTEYRYHRLKTGEAAVARSVTATDISCSIQ